MAVETTGKYCSICGKDVAEPTFERFGEPFCSEAHAEAFVGEVRAARAALVAQRPVDDGPSAATDTGRAPQPAHGPWSPGRLVKLGACYGLPVAALVFLAGGGGALLGGAAALLPTLALLACPIGMFFMMRAMQRHGEGGQHGRGDRKGGGADGNR
jgi:hypothetical protein